MSVYQEIRDILVGLGVEPRLIRTDATLADDLGIDSTEAVELNVALERRFGCATPAKWYRGKTVSDLVGFVERNVGCVS